MKLIDKSALVAEIKKLEDEAKIYPSSFDCGRLSVCKELMNFIDTLEVKEENSVWHNIDDTPNYNLNGISDFIIDSCYGHIYGEAHSYTPEQWSAHIGFNANRQFRWAYEKDLINFE